MENKKGVEFTLFCPPRKWWQRKSKGDKLSFGSVIDAVKRSQERDLSYTWNRRDEDR